MSDHLPPSFHAALLLDGLCRLDGLVDRQDLAAYWQQGLLLLHREFCAASISLHLLDFDPSPTLSAAGNRRGELSPPAAAYLENWEQRLQSSADQPDGAADQRRLELGPLLADGVQFVHARVYVEQVLRGALSMAFAAGRRPSDADLGLLEPLVQSFVGNALRAENMQRVNQRLQRADLLYQVSQTITSSLDMITVLNRTTELVTHVLGAEAATLYRIDEENRELIFMVIKGEAAELLEEQRMPVENGVAGWVATHGTPIVVNDTRASKLFSAEVDARTGFTTRNIVCVPLRVQERVIGVLELLNKANGGDFDADDVDWLATIAQMIAIALDNAQLFRSEQKKVQELATLNQISQTIISNLDVSTVLAEITQSVLEIAEADRSELFLSDERLRTYRLQACAGYGADQDVDTSPIALDTGIAGWTISQRAALAVHCAKEDGRYLPHPHLPELNASSIAAAPLSHRGRTVGAIVVYALSGRRFDEERQKILQTFANQAAIALRNAELYQDLRAEQERIIRAQEEVRHQLARDLHDNTAQMLSLVIMNLDMARQMLAKNKIEALAAELTTLETLARQANQEVRTLLFELRPIILESRGLIPALRAYDRQLQKSLNCAIFLELQPLDFQMSQQGASAIFGIIQEAVNNIRRHARAANIWIRIHSDATHLMFEVEDDGVGFDFAATIENYYDAGSYGLLNMHERASVFSGSLTIESPRPGSNLGVLVRTVLPKSRLRIPSDEVEQPVREPE